MNNPLKWVYPTIANLNHWLDRTNDHSIHSPIAYDMYKHIVSKTYRPQFPILESIFINNHPEKRKFYYRLGDYFQSERIVVVGSKTGLSSLYLAHLPNANVTTLEGHRPFVDCALTNFEYSSMPNLEIIEGNPERELNRLLDQSITIDFILLQCDLQANSAFLLQKMIENISQRGVIALSRVHESAERNHLWNEWRSHHLVSNSVDMMFCGLLFFHPGIEKNHYIWTL